MTPQSPQQSKLNLLRANLKQFQDSDHFTASEKQKLCAPIVEQIDTINALNIDIIYEELKP
jgi:hypothetical protein